MDGALSMEGGGGEVQAEVSYMYREPHSPR
jgi:hypothetical protein